MHRPSGCPGVRIISPVCDPDPWSPYSGRGTCLPPPPGGSRVSSGNPLRKRVVFTVYAVVPALFFDFQPRFWHCRRAAFVDRWNHREGGATGSHLPFRMRILHPWQGVPVISSCSRTNTISSHTPNM